LRAKARYDRWDEDFRTIGSEMTWTVLYFVYHRRLWETRAEASKKVGKRGHQAYALKQAAMWERFAMEGTREFGDLMK
jgi:hypothetical protein